MDIRMMLIKTLETSNKNFQIVTFFFDFAVLLQNKLTDSIKRHIQKKKTPRVRHFFFKDLFNKNTGCDKCFEYGRFKELVDRCGEGAEITGGVFGVW